MKQRTVDPDVVELVAAIRANLRYRVMELIHEEMVSPNAVDEDGIPVIFHALYAPPPCDKDQMTSVLLLSGANPFARTPSGVVAFNVIEQYPSRGSVLDPLHFAQALLGVGKALSHKHQHPARLSEVQRGASMSESELHVPALRLGSARRMLSAQHLPRPDGNVVDEVKLRSSGQDISPGAGVGRVVHRDRSARGAG